MHCPTCGLRNATDRRFCAGCGAALLAGCSACGFANQPDARFCGGCGAPIMTAGQAPKPSSGPPAATPPPGELRQVTVLFADLSGFTELSSALEAEETHRILGRFFEVVDGLVEQHGGTVDKHIGDGVMAVFGAPIAHGDDPMRAVRTACAIHEAMAGLGESLGRTLTVHIGVASGAVVAAGLGRNAHAEYTVVGDSVNLAARLHDLAKPGETLISDSLYHTVNPYVECEPLGPLAVKGIVGPVRAWRVRALLDEATEQPRGPFVGRTGEQRQFTSLIESCRDTRCGQVVLVRGEAGIGKTRLVQEFATLARERGFAVHKGLVFDFGVGRGQDAIPALVRSLSGLPGRHDPAARQQAADRLLADGVVAPDRRVFLNDLLDLPQPSELRMMYDAMDNATRSRGKQTLIKDLVVAASAQHPILLVVEDIHWADQSTLAYLASVATTLKDLAAVLIMTSRIEGDPMDQAWRVGVRGTPLVTFDLGPLRNDEAVALAAAFVESTNRWAAACVKRAGGNPLFLEQLLRNAEESGEESVPPSIQSLVLARLDRLAPADKQALQAAAVLGQRFSLDPLRRLIADPHYRCAAMIEHCLVRPEGEDYLFAHALIQEAVYGSLLKARRQELHRHAATWFESRDPILHAEHLDRAGDAAAAQAYLGAARAQASGYRYERALELADRGFVLATEPADRFALACLRGELLHDLGPIRDSMDAYRAALDMAEDDAGRCTAWIGLAAGMRVADQYDQALDALDRAEQIATDQQLAQIHHLRGNLYFPLGRLEECREAHGRALDFARRAGSPEAEVRALGGLGDAEYVRGRMISAHRNFNRCVELCREHGFGRIEVANLPMAAFTQFYCNDLHGARERAREAVDMAIRVGHRRAELIARHGLTVLGLETADYSSAKSEIARAHDITQQLGATRFEPENLVFSSIILRAAGDRRGAFALAQKALPISRSTGITYMGPVVLAALACATDDATLRENALAEAEAVLESGAVGHNYLLFYREAMDLALQLEDWERADRYATALEDYTRPEPLPWSDFFIARTRALAAYGRGARDEATLENLRRLSDEARRVGLLSALPDLEAALAAA